MKDGTPKLDCIYLCDMCRCRPESNILMDISQSTYRSPPTGVRDKKMLVPRKEIGLYPSSFLLPLLLTLIYVFAICMNKILQSQYLLCYEVLHKPVCVILNMKAHFLVGNACYSKI